MLRRLAVGILRQLVNSSWRPSILYKLWDVSALIACWHSDTWGCVRSDNVGNFVTFEACRSWPLAVTPAPRTSRNELIVKFPMFECDVDDSARRPKPLDELRLTACAYSDTRGRVRGVSV